MTDDEEVEQELSAVVERLARALEGSPLPAQLLPEVRHSGFKAAQVPSVQVPPQHSPSTVQASPSDVH